MKSAKHAFFCPTIESGYLSAEESNHAVRVLRLQGGQVITLFDGDGTEAIAEILQPDKKQLSFNIIEQKKTAPFETHIHIAISPTKNMDRFQFFIEKATEIGVNEITPVYTSNSERKTLNLEKIEKHAISALKQSGNVYLPKIHEPLKFNEFIKQKTPQNHRFIAHCETDNDKRELKDQLNGIKFVTILIGPEGDFTPEEINLAKKEGWLPTGLGTTRLRTETAGIVACHTVRVIV